MNETTHQMLRPSRERPRLAEELCLASIITLAYLAVPGWLADVAWRLIPEGLRTETWWYWSHALLRLLFGLTLTLGTVRRSGLQLGSIRKHWKGVVLVCGIPVVVTAIIYPLLPERPFANWPVTMWLVTPLSEDLVFSGYLYGRFEHVTRAYVHPRIRIRWALVLAAVFFSLGHLPNFLSMSAGYVALQLAYTFLGLVLFGLSRQWTGSIIYVTATHMACNLIAHAIP